MSNSRWLTAEVKRWWPGLERLDLSVRLKVFSPITGLGPDSRLQACDERGQLQDLSRPAANETPQIARYAQRQLRSSISLASQRLDEKRLEGWAICGEN